MWRTPWMTSWSTRAWAAVRLAVRVMAGLLWPEQHHFRKRQIVLPRPLGPLEEARTAFLEKHARHAWDGGVGVADHQRRAARGQVAAERAGAGGKARRAARIDQLHGRQRAAGDAAAQEDERRGAGGGIADQHLAAGLGVGA